MPKSADEVLQNALMHAYDPVKAHDYYVRTRKLKGRKSGAKVIPISRKSTVKALRKDKPSSPVELQQKITALKSRLDELHARLREILQGNQKDSGKQDDDKKSAAEKSKAARDAKIYRDKHEAELAQKRKRKSDTGGGGGKTSLADMSEGEVRVAIQRTRSNLQAAITQARTMAKRSTA